MTARSEPTAVQLADELRARLWHNRKVWLALHFHPKFEDFNLAEFSDRDDDGGRPLPDRDPRAVCLELAQLRKEFWSRHLTAPEVREVALRAVKLWRHLSERRDREGDRRDAAELELGCHVGD